MSFKPSDFFFSAAAGVAASVIILVSKRLIEVAKRSERRKAISRHGLLILLIGAGVIAIFFSARW